MQSKHVYGTHLLYSEAQWVKGLVMAIRKQVLSGKGSVRSILRGNGALTRCQKFRNFPVHR